MAEPGEYLPYSRPLITDEDVAAVVEALGDVMISQGERQRNFEVAFAERVGASFGVAFSSGSAALHAMCYAAGLGEGDEVIVPALTFAGTANAIRHVGATPVFADIDPETFLLAPENVADRLTPKTSAILTVDYAGQPSYYDELRALAENHELLLLADTAHSPGSTYKSQTVGGSTALMSAFSFNPVKNLTSAEGGMVTGSDGRHVSILQRFRVHGMTRDPELLQQPAPESWYYEQQFPGFNYKLSELHAALGHSQLRRLDQMNARRSDVAAAYAGRLQDLPLDLPIAREGVGHTWHLYVVRTREGTDRDRLFGFLRSRGIGVQLHYIPVPLHPDYRSTGFSLADCPVTEDFFHRALSLPCHAAMTDDDVDRVVSEIENFFGARG